MYDFLILLSGVVILMHTMKHYITDNIPNKEKVEIVYTLDYSTLNVLD